MKNNIRKKTSSLSFFGITLFCFAGIISLLFYTSNPYILFASVGFFSSAIFLIPPALQFNYKLYSTWSFLGLSLFLGLTIRGLYIAIGYPDGSTLSYYYFLGESADYFIMPSFLLLLSLFITAISFVYMPVKNRSFFPEKNNVSLKRLYSLSLISLVVSIVSIYFYIKFTGGLDITNLSSKRSTIESLNLTANHRTWQSLITLTTISFLSFLFILVDILKGRKRFYKYVLAALLFLSSIFLPFYTSSRNDLIMFFILTGVTIYHLNPKIRWGKLFIVLFLMIISFHVMSVLRSTKDTSLTEVISNISFSSDLLDSLVLNRNGLELAKTTHIINSMPDILDFQYGKTILSYIIAPIPRELWSSKPLISPGPIIGTKIYGNRVSGVPPGFVGEMYWNFHVPGIILGSIFLGWMLKWVNIRFKVTGFSIPIYTFGPIQLGYLIIGISSGYGIMIVTIKTILALSFFKLITNNNKFN